MLATTTLAGGCHSASHQHGEESEYLARGVHHRITVEDGFAVELPIWSLVKRHDTDDPSPTALFQLAILDTLDLLLAMLLCGQT